MKSKKVAEIKIASLKHQDLLEDMEENAKSLSQDKPAQMLNPREYLFVHNIVSGMDVSESTLKAGYKNRTHGFKLLDKPYIKDIIERKMATFELGRIYKREHFIGDLHGLLQEAMNVRDKDMIKFCISQIGKVGGFYVPDTQVNIQQNINSIKIEIVRPGDIPTSVIEIDNAPQDEQHT